MPANTSCVSISGLGHGENYEDNSLNVFQYFNASCFSGYRDDDRVSRFDAL